MFVENQVAPEQTSDGFRRRLAVLFASLGLANLLAWIWAVTTFAGEPVLLGAAVLAYSLGLRHALDADHIAAIDNVTRKLMQEGTRPLAVGLFFALGHSAVVFLASAIVAVAAGSLTGRLAEYRELGGLVGTGASALFLFVIAALNIVVLFGVYRAFLYVRAGKHLRGEEVDALLQQRGWLARLFRPLFGFVSRSWHLFPIGFLFALGFETASEISLFGLSTQASGKAASWTILVFPTLFAAGMTLVDTLDGVLMLGAYGWAYRNPMRKLFYNVIITSLSVLVALVIGGMETLGLLADHFALQGGFWNWIASLNADFGTLGYAIVALFAVSWALSILIDRAKSYGCL